MTAPAEAGVSGDTAIKKTPATMTTQATTTPPPLTIKTGASSMTSTQYVTSGFLPSPHVNTPSRTATWSRAASRRNGAMKDHVLMPRMRHAEKLEGSRSAGNNTLFPNAYWIATSASRARSRRQRCLGSGAERGNTKREDLPSRVVWDSLYMV